MAIATKEPHFKPYIHHFTPCIHHFTPYIIVRSYLRPTDVGAGGDEEPDALQGLVQAQHRPRVGPDLLNDIVV